MPEFMKNGYEDDDMRSVINEIEKLEAQKKSIMAAASGECSALSKKISKLKKEAKDDLKIPLEVLNATLKTRKLERQIDEVAKSVSADFIEVYEDAIGQFSFFAPDDEQEGAAPSPAQKAAERAREAVEANQAREQEEGAQILNDIVGKVH